MFSLEGACLKGSKTTDHKRNHVALPRKMDSHSNFKSEDVKQHGRFNVFLSNKHKKNAHCLAMATTLEVFGNLSSIIYHEVSSDDSFSGSQSAQHGRLLCREWSFGFHFRLGSCHICKDSTLK